MKRIEEFFKKRGLAKIDPHEESGVAERLERLGYQFDGKEITYQGGGLLKLEPHAVHSVFLGEPRKDEFEYRLGIARTAEPLLERICLKKTHHVSLVSFGIRTEEGVRSIFVVIRHLTSRLDRLKQVFSRYSLEEFDVEKHPLVREHLELMGVKFRKGIAQRFPGVLPIARKARQGTVAADYFPSFAIKGIFLGKPVGESDVGTIALRIVESLKPQLNRNSYVVHVAVSRMPDGKIRPVYLVGNKELPEDN